MTKACARALLPAVDGKRVDANHPVAVAYVEKQARAKTPPAATGLDPRYEEAIHLCAAQGRYSARAVREGLHIGFARASRIMAQMRAAGQVPEKGAPAAPPPPPPARKVRTGGTQDKQQRALADLAAYIREDPEEGTGLVEIPEDISLFLDIPLGELISRFGTSTAFLDWLSATQKIEMINEKRLKNAKTEGELVSRAVVKQGVIDPVDGVFTRMLTDGSTTIASRAHAVAKAGGDVDEVRSIVEDQLSSFIKPAKVTMTRALRDA